jgi:hypothetical protein
MYVDNDSNMADVILPPKTNVTTFKPDVITSQVQHYIPEKFQRLDWRNRTRPCRRTRHLKWPTWFYPKIQHGGLVVHSGGGRVVKCE